MDGDYGVDIPFEKGLFILRVENSHGKSTCMNAIAYALGMEKSLGQKNSKLPFPPSLTKSIDNKDGIEIGVLSSRVYLELENSKGEVVTLLRHIVGGDGETIIHMANGELDMFSLNPKVSLFLHKEGDTTRERGFYYWVGKFVGWVIPNIPLYNGKDAPLYPATFFPTYYVEQKKGWSSIQATTPQVFNIRDPKKRAVEFILNLDVNDIIIKRAKLKTAIEEVNTAWIVNYKKAEVISNRISGKLTGLMDKPESKFDQYRVDFSINENDRWESVQSLITGLKEKQLRMLISGERKNEIEDENIEVLKKIEERQRSINEIGEKNSEVSSEISFVEHQITATEKRISSLAEDRRKYEDLKKVGESNIFNGDDIGEGNCPTCSQSYSDNLLDSSTNESLMSVDQSLNYIKEQIKTFSSALVNSKSQYEYKKAEYSKNLVSLVELRKGLNGLNRSVRNTSESIIEDKLREKIQLENKIESYTDAVCELFKLRLKFDELHTKYTDLIAKRRKMPESYLSEIDNKKLNYLQTLLRGYLKEYGFSSFSADKLEISKDNYLPTREGFDIGFDTSASDGVRIIWSYLLSLFSLSLKFETNHPNLLMFDEPRQQEANKVSFSSLLKSVSKACGEKGQIILATSEEVSVLSDSLVEEKYTLKVFEKNDGKILRKLHS